MDKPKTANQKHSKLLNRREDRARDGANNIKSATPLNPLRHEHNSPNVSATRDLPCLANA
ncbi:MAG: hypothetical protein M2R45_05316 [Verrucomicrobia subdivision 3 bacterium]|nr:hypothetical protein [Limisphaerales bacterium]MCS1415712.1 hypothetical protein [Limisphaerales bacterium]